MVRINSLVRSHKENTIQGTDILSSLDVLQGLSRTQSLQWCDEDKDKLLQVNPLPRLVYLKKRYTKQAAALKPCQLVLLVQVV